MSNQLARAAALALCLLVAFSSSVARSDEKSVGLHDLVTGPLLKKVVDVTGTEGPWRWPGSEEIKAADSADQYPHAARASVEGWYKRTLITEYRPDPFPKTEFVIGTTHYGRWEANGIQVQVVQTGYSIGFVFTIPKQVKFDKREFKASTLAAVGNMIFRDPQLNPLSHAVSVDKFKNVPFKCSQKLYAKMGPERGLIWHGCRDTMFGPLQAGTEVHEPNKFWFGLFVDQATAFLDKEGYWYLLGRGWSDDVRIWSNGRLVGLKAGKRVRGQGCPNSKTSCPWFDPEDKREPGHYGPYHSINGPY